MITIKDLGLTQKQIEDFVKGARIAYGTPKLPEPSKETPSVLDAFTNILPRK